MEESETEKFENRPKISCNFVQLINAKGSQIPFLLGLIVFVNDCLTSFEPLLVEIISFHFYILKARKAEKSRKRKGWREESALRLWLIDGHSNEMSVIQSALSPGAQVTRTETPFVHIGEGPAFPLPVCEPGREWGQGAMARHGGQWHPPYISIGAWLRGQGWKRWVGWYIHSHTQGHQKQVRPPLPDGMLRFLFSISKERAAGC